MVLFFWPPLVGSNKLPNAMHDRASSLPATKAPHSETVSPRAEQVELCRLAGADEADKAGHSRASCERLPSAGQLDGISSPRKSPVAGRRSSVASSPGPMDGRILNFAAKLPLPPKCSRPELATLALGPSLGRRHSPGWPMNWAHKFGRPSGRMFSCRRSPPCMSPAGCDFASCRCVALRCVVTRDGASHQRDTLAASCGPGKPASWLAGCASAPAGRGGAAHSQNKRARVCMQQQQ